MRSVRIHLDQHVIASLQPPVETRKVGLPQSLLARPVQHVDVIVARSQIIGEATHKAGVISFTLEQVHPHDLGTILDSEGVAVRAGHHCAMPVMEFFGVPATARASFGCYTNREDVDQLIGALHRALEVFG